MINMKWRCSSSVIDRGQTLSPNASWSLIGRAIPELLSDWSSQRVWRRLWGLKGSAAGSSSGLQDSQAGRGQLRCSSGESGGSGGGMSESSHGEALFGRVFGGILSPCSLNLLRCILWSVCEGFIFWGLSCLWFYLAVLSSDLVSSLGLILSQQGLSFIVDEKNWRVADQPGGRPQITD